VAQASWQRVTRASSRLSGLAVQAMDELPWFRALAPAQRSWVGLVVQSGLVVFADWVRHPGGPVPVGPEVFAAAPRDLARAVSLKQTVQLIRIAVDVVEQEVPSLAAPGDDGRLREAVLRYSRELAFAAADVYAAAAEARGAWDARVEAGVVEALVRGQTDELTLSRVASLGWRRTDWVLALALPASDEVDPAALRSGARHSGLCLLTGEAAGALVLLVGGAGTPELALKQLVQALPDGPIVVGPQTAELATAGRCLREALGALAAVRAWPQAPRPVSSADLLAERVILGEEAAREQLLEEVYNPLVAAGGDLVITAGAYLEGGGSVEGAGRALFLHPNTVRYRLRKMTDVLQRDLTSPRDAFVVRLALVLGRSGRL